MAALGLGSGVDNIWDIACQLTQRIRGARPPNTFDELLSLKTVILVNLDHMKVNKVKLLGVSHRMYPVNILDMPLVPPELTPLALGTTVLASSHNVIING